jgi:anti-sigma factor RsiW
VGAWVAAVTARGPCADIRLELGVYLLGAIEPAKRAVVDRHLAACPRCRAELAELAGLPSLIRTVPAEVFQQPPPDGAPGVPGPALSALLEQVGRVRRRRSLLIAAAALLAGFAAASGLQALQATVARAPPPAATTQVITVAGASPVTHARAAVRYWPQPWGTELQVRVTGVAVGTRCQLLVTSSQGQQVAASSWRIAVSRQLAWYPAAVPFTAASVRSLEVTAGGKNLVTITAPPDRKR